jgi:DNA-binding response OmpR family regulator
MSPNRRRQILLVDDDAELVTVVGDRLRGEGFHVIPACTAAEGLHILKRRTPDLIVLDIGMRGMNGITFLDRVAACSGRRPRIIVLTARPNSEEIARHPAATAVMAKTSGSENLLREIHRLLPAAGAAADAALAEPG